jgi:hypothetical protein
LVEKPLRRLVGVHVGLAEGAEDVVVGVAADDLLDGLDGGVDRRRRGARLLVGGSGPAAAAAASHDRRGDRRTLRRRRGSRRRWWCLGSPPESHQTRRGPGFGSGFWSGWVGLGASVLQKETLVDAIYILYLINKIDLVRN